MNLIKLSPNILVNPSSISCVEQKKVNGKETVIVWVDGRSYTLGIPVRDFMMALDNMDIPTNGQHWAG